MDKYEFMLRLIAMLSLIIILALDVIYWKIDHAVIITIAFLIGLMSGLKISKIVIKPVEVDEDG